MQAELEEMREKLADDVAEISGKWEDVLTEVETFTVTPRRSDVRIDLVGVGWMPVWAIPGPGGAVQRGVVLSDVELDCHVQANLIEACGGRIVA